MPRPRMTAEQRRQAEWEQADAEIRGRLYQWTGETRMNMTDLADRAGIKRATLYRRIADPSTFSIDEVRRIRNVIGDFAV